MISKRKIFSDSFKLIYEELLYLTVGDGRKETSKMELEYTSNKKQRGIFEIMNK